MPRLPSFNMNPLGALEAMARTGAGYARDTAGRGLGDWWEMMQLMGQGGQGPNVEPPERLEGGLDAADRVIADYGSFLPQGAMARPMLPFGNFGRGLSGGFKGWEQIKADPQLYRQMNRAFAIPRFQAAAGGPSPAGIYLQRGFRMAPARSKGEEMKRQYMLAQLKQLTRATDEDLRGLRWLPELDPKQNAFREFLMNRPYTGPLERGPAYDRLIAGLEHVTENPALRRGARAAQGAQAREPKDQVAAIWGPQHSEQLLRGGTNESISGVSAVVDQLRSQAKAGNVDSYVIDDAISKIDRLLNDDINMYVAAVKDPHLSSLANLPAEDLMSRAARLAAMRIQLHRRQPGRMMNAGFKWRQTSQKLGEGERLEGIRQLRNPADEAFSYSTEERAHFQLWDDSRKALFRNLMQQRRNLMRDR